MSKFKVGDKVVCIDGSLPKGEIYTVRESYKRSYDDYVLLCLNDSKGKKQDGWYETRFELYIGNDLMTAVDIISKEASLKREADKAYGQVQLLNSQLHMQKSLESIGDAVQDYYNKLSAWLEFRNASFEEI